MRPARTRRGGWDDRYNDTKAYLTMSCKLRYGFGKEDEFRLVSLIESHFSNDARMFVDTPRAGAADTQGDGPGLICNAPSGRGDIKTPATTKNEGGGMGPGKGPWCGAGEYPRQGALGWFVVPLRGGGNSKTAATTKNGGGGIRLGRGPRREQGSLRRGLSPPRSLMATLTPFHRYNR